MSATILDNEPGVGPGPLKEFFEMCLMLFTTEPIAPSTSTTAMMSSTNGPSLGIIRDSNDLVSLEENELRASEPSGHENGQDQSTSYLYSSFFPLFQPAGEAYPECIIPRPLQLIGYAICFF